MANENRIMGTEHASVLQDLKETVLKVVKVRDLQIW